MSVVGIDLRQHGFDVLWTDESKRETPALVAFNEKQRFIGIAASASFTVNPKNTIVQIKRSIGHLYCDPEVHQDIRNLPFSITKGPNGSPLPHVQYLREARSFSPAEVVGMVLSSLKGSAEKNLQTHVTDCVIGISIFFKEIQRHAVLDATAIPGLCPLRLMHELTTPLP
ncbi:hypothetical protein GOP47_0024933 [Adiantum capillus-veneris]|uniref:Uncharacterized protein n=1 Tax=Adiantum capillus-veneris TaxID=13818 RepID=A0A9D4U3X0_ADICA|nr:hypothetical protein GOP47_0024933 [Adiantum capillus-veneris]